MPGVNKVQKTVELVDHTYDGRRVARRTHTSVDRNALTALLRSCRVILLLLILYNTLVSVTELFAKDRKYDDLLPYLTCRGTSHGHHHQQFFNNSGKFEDLVLMIAKRQTYRHRDRDIIQIYYSIVFFTTSVLEAI